MKGFIDRYLTFLVISFIIISIFLTYYRYIILKDYERYESEKIEEENYQEIII